MHGASPTLCPPGNPLEISFLVDSLNFMQILCKHLNTKFIFWEYILVFVLYVGPNHKVVIFYSSFIQSLILFILYAKYLLSTFCLLFSALLPRQRRSWSPACSVRSGHRTSLSAYYIPYLHFLLYTIIWVNFLQNRFVHVNVMLKNSKTAPWWQYQWSKKKFSEQFYLTENPVYIGDRNLTVLFSENPLLFAEYL